MNEYLELHALADNELSDDARNRISERLRNDPKLAAEFDAICALKKSVHAKAEVADSAEAWSLAIQRLDAIDKTQRAQNFVTRYAWAICGAFFLFILGGAWMNRSLSKNTLYTGDMPRLMSSLSPVPLIGLGDNSQNDLGKLAEGAPVQACPSNLQVRGACKGFFEDRRAMCFELADDRGSMNLIVVANTDEIRAAEQTTSNREYRSCEVNRQNCVTWVDRGFAFLLFGDRSDGELRTVADSIR